MALAFGPGRGVEMLGYVRAGFAGAALLAVCVMRRLCWRCGAALCSLYATPVKPNRRCGVSEPDSAVRLRSGREHPMRSMTLCVGVSLAIACASR